MPKNTKLFTWTLKQADRNDPLGDLAWDIHHDEDFPTGEVAQKKYLRNLAIGRPGLEESVEWLLDEYESFNVGKSSRDGISKSYRFVILKRDGYMCQLCGASPNNERTPGITLEVDHIHPVSKGGGNEPDNLQTLCFDCNRGKGTKTL